MELTVDPRTSQAVLRFVALLVLNLNELQGGVRMLLESASPSIQQLSHSQVLPTGLGLQVTVPVRKL